MFSHQKIYSEGFTSIVRILLHECSISVMEETRNGIIPLHLAALNGHLDTVCFLAEQKNSKPDFMDHQGTTSLHRAAHEGHLEIAKFLVNERKCDPLLKIKGQGFTALHLASQ